MRSPKPLGNVLVLIVDDHDDTRYLLGLALEQAGARTATAAGGQEALTRLDGELRPDVIVSDVSMPVFSGHEFIRAVRRLPSAVRDTPAVALTAHNDRGQRDEALAAGFQAYVVKPCETETLVRAIVRVLGERARSA